MYTPGANDHLYTIYDPRVDGEETWDQWNLECRVIFCLKLLDRVNCADSAFIIFYLDIVQLFQKYATCWVFLALLQMLYLFICEFVYLYFCICAFDSWEYNLCWVFLALRHMLYLFICVFVYLCICVFVFACLTHGNIIFNILEQSPFQKYAICRVFLALCHMLCLCICIFV